MEKGYILIPLWASKNLGLKGNELMVFSYIYGFSQDGRSYCFTPMKEICELLNITPKTIFNCIKSLTEKNLLQKLDLDFSNTSGSGYKINSQYIEKLEEETCKNFLGAEKSTKQNEENSLDYIAKNNINNNIFKNNNINNCNNNNSSNINSEINLSNSNSDVNSCINLNSINSENNKEKEKENISKPIGLSICFSKEKQNFTKEKQKRFTRPSLEEVRAYIREKNYDIDANTFFDYYDSCGWTVGKNKPMKDWKASVRYWNSTRKNNGYASKPTEEEHQLNVRQYFPGDEDKIPF